MEKLYCNIKVCKGKIVLQDNKVYCNKGLLEVYCNRKKIVLQEKA